MTPEQILRVLERQDFFDFYAEPNGMFTRYIEGGDPDETPSKEEVLAKISQLFRLKKARIVTAGDQK